MYRVQEVPQTVLHPRPPHPHKKGGNAASSAAVADLSHLPTGQEGAQLAASSAITSVNWAMQQVHDDHEAQAGVIRRLEAENEALKREAEALRSGLRDATHEAETTALSLKENSVRSEELFRALTVEQAAFARLKEELTAQQNECRAVAEANARLVERQVDEKNVRDELALEMSSMQEEINALELEKSKTLHRYAELEIQLRVEKDTFEQNAEAWNLSKRDYLKQIHACEAKLRHALSSEESMREEVRRLEEQAEYLNAQVRARDGKLAEVGAEHSACRDELKSQRALNEQSRQKCDAVRNALDESRAELQEAKEQLRVMAEKVFQLMSQLQQLDQWKDRASEEQLEASRAVLMHRRKSETLTRQLAEEEKRRQSLQGENTKLTSRLERTLAELRDQRNKAVASTKARKRLSSELRGQGSLADSAAKKAAKSAALLEQAKSRLSEHQVAAARHEKERQRAQLRERQQANEITQLQRKLAQQRKAVAARDAELARWRRKEDIFRSIPEAGDAEAVGQALDDMEQFEGAVEAEVGAEDFDDTAVLAGASSAAASDGRRAKSPPPKTTTTTTKGSSRGKQPRMRRSRSTPAARRVVAVRSKPANMHAEARRHRMAVRKLLRSRNGERLTSALHAAKLDEKHVLQWQSSPQEFFKGLNALVAALQQQKESRASPAAGGAVELMREKNRQLAKRLERVESSRVRTVMQLTGVLLEGVSAGGGGGGGGGGSGGGGDSGDSMLTQQQKKDGKKDTGAAGSIITKGAGVPALTLTHCGLDCSDATMLAKALSHNAVVTDADLRHNQIGDKGLADLVLHALADSSAVQVLDLRRNRVTLEGLETLVRFLESSCGLGAVVGASLSETSDSRVVPYINVRTRHKTLVVDLRENKHIFPAGSHEHTRRRIILEQLAATLVAASRGLAPRVMVEDGGEGDGGEEGAEGAGKGVEGAGKDKVASSPAQAMQEAARAARASAAARQSGGGTFNQRVLRGASHTSVTLWQPKKAAAVPYPSSSSHHFAAEGRRLVFDANGAGEAAGTPHYLLPRRGAAKAAAAASRRNSSPAAARRSRSRGARSPPPRARRQRKSASVRGLPKISK